MLVSTLCGDLPPFCNFDVLRLSDAAGGYPGGVQDCSLLHVTARPATTAPVAALLLWASSLQDGPVTPASTRTQRREQALVPYAPAMASDHTHYPENFRRHLRWPPRRPADGQQRTTLRREGDRMRSWGLISPSRRTFSTAPAGAYPLVLTRGIGVHNSSLVSKPVPAGKRPPGDTSPAAQRTGGHRPGRRRAVTQRQRELTQRQS